MEQFITLAANKLGLSQSAVESAVGVVLNLIKENAGDGDFQQLLTKLPGAEGVLAKAGDGKSASGGGLLGAAASVLGGALGGGSGSAMGALGKLKDTGLETDQLGSLLAMFKDHASQDDGGDLVGKLLEGVPGIKELVS